MSTFADFLAHISDSIGDAEQHARTSLDSKNLADVLAAAKAKITQALGHPDLHKIIAAGGGDPGAQVPQNPTGAA